MTDKEKQDAALTSNTRLRRGYWPVGLGLRGRGRAFNRGLVPVVARPRAGTLDGAQDQLPAGAEAGSWGQDPAVAVAGAEAGSGGQDLAGAVAGAGGQLPAGAAAVSGGPEPAGAVAVAGADALAGADAGTGGQLATGYKYRRPVPVPDEEDFAEGKLARESAMKELETGLEVAAHGPPHKGVDEDDDGDGDLHTALSRSSSLNTEEVVAFAMDWEDGDDGQEDRDKKRAASSDPAEFQNARDTARSQLAMAAFFASTGKNMLQEHDRARKEADLYMAEVS